MPLKDRDARRAYHRNYMRRRYQENASAREKQKSYNKKHRPIQVARAKAVIIEWKASGCKLCRETDQYCLVAHHLDPSKKELVIGLIPQQGYSVIRIRQELDKCICLCGNCHAKVHAGLLNVEGM